MDRRTPSDQGASHLVWRGLSWLVAALTALAAAGVAAVLTVVFAAGLVIFAVLSAVLLAFSAATLRARRAVHAGASSTLFEAKRIGGHSWVAYGWDEGR